MYCKYTTNHIYLNQNNLSIHNVCVPGRFNLVLKKTPHFVDVLNKLSNVSLLTFGHGLNTLSKLISGTIWSN